MKKKPPLDVSLAFNFWLDLFQACFNGYNDEQPPFVPLQLRFGM